MKTLIELIKDINKLSIGGRLRLSKAYGKYFIYLYEKNTEKISPIVEGASFVFVRNSLQNVLSDIIVERLDASFNK